MGDRQVKDEFIASWNDMLPAGVLNLAETALPAAPGIETPIDVDSAIIAQGILAKYLLDVFAVFEGFTPVDLILHIGQRNAVNKAILLAGLELSKEDAEKHEIAIDAPPSTYSTLDSPMLCQIELFGDLTGLSDVWVDVVYPDQTTATAGMDSSIDINGETIQEENHFYTLIGVNYPGEYILTFSATVEGYTFSAQPLTITVL